jgi:hypothetical protein
MQAKMAIAVRDDPLKSSPSSFGAPASSGFPRIQFGAKKAAHEKSA